MKIRLNLVLVLSASLGVGLLRATPTSGKTLFYLKDHLGSVRSVVDASSKQVVETASYYPMGSKIEELCNIESVTRKTTEGYSGQELDEDGPSLGVKSLSLHYYGARYLDAKIGRWNARDPLEDESVGLNPYNFVKYNALRWVDVWGMSGEDIAGSYDNSRYSENWDPYYYVNDDGSYDVIYLFWLFDNLWCEIAFYMWVDSRVEARKALDSGEYKNVVANYENNVLPHRIKVREALNKYCKGGDNSGNDPGSETQGLGEGALTALAAATQWHFDPLGTGGKGLHVNKELGGFRFDKYGQLVKHSGKVIGPAKGKALKVLKFLKNVKPDFFATPATFMVIPPELQNNIQNYERILNPNLPPDS